MDNTSTSPIVSYADRWSKRKRAIVGPLDEETAQSRHASGQLYAVVLGDPEKPTAHLEVQLEGGVVKVHFLDEELRDHLTYIFARPPGSTEDLFLEQTFRREYGSSDELSFGEHYLFDPPNLVHVKKRNPLTREAVTYDIETDLAKNYEPVPVFGDYQSIARLER